MGIKATVLSVILMLLSFLHHSSCFTNSLEKLVTDLKIKAITSFELRSMTFNELPTLYFLYDNIVRKRFEAVYKTENDKDEKYAEFRKIHQFYAFNSTFEANYKFRDVILNVWIPVKELGIFKNNWNWTDDQMIKGGFLTNDSKGFIKFQDDSFIDFFIAQYLFDHIFKPVDHVSDDEMELRLRFLFHLTSDSYDQRPQKTYEFISGIVENLEKPVLSDQVRMLMKYRFKYLFDNILPNRIKFVEKISRIFQKDEQIVRNLWRADDSHPYFLRFLRFTSSGENISELRDIAGKFFKINGTNTPQNGAINAPNIFKGRNQQLSILFYIYRMQDVNFTKALLEVTQAPISNENLQKIQQKINFLDLVDAGSFSKEEKQEFYIANGFDFISIAGTGDGLMDIWRRLTKLFKNNEIKRFLIEKDHTYNHTHLFLLSSHNDQTYVQKFLDLTQRYLTHEEIRELLMQKNPITGNTFIIRFLRIVIDVKNLEQCWDFAKEYLKQEELQDLLLDNNEESFFENIVMNQVIFKYSTQMLADVLSKDDIRNMLMQTDNKNRTIIWTVYANLSNELRIDVVNYLKDIFNGHEDELKKLIATRDIYGNTIFSDSDPYAKQEGLPVFEDLAKELFSEIELKELKKHLLFKGDTHDVQNLGGEGSRIL